MFSLNHNHMPFAEAGPASPLIVAAGIRDLASREEAVDMALELKRIFSRFGLPFVFKPCFNAASGCWPGGLADLAAIREQADVPVMAAVHDSSQLEAAADAANVIFLSADTAGLPQMLAELGRRDCAVILRKGLYSFSREMADLAGDARNAGIRRLALCEGGTSFGYDDLVIDMRSLGIMQGIAPVFFDASYAFSHASVENCFFDLSHSVSMASVAYGAAAQGLAGMTLDLLSRSSSTDPSAPGMLSLGALPAFLERITRIDRCAKGLA